MGENWIGGVEWIGGHGWEGKNEGKLYPRCKNQNNNDNDNNKRGDKVMVSLHNTRTP